MKRPLGASLPPIGGALLKSGAVGFAKGTPMKLLIIRPSALGDSLMLMPSLFALRGMAETLLVGRRPGVDFLAPYVHQAMDYESLGWHLLYAEDREGLSRPSLPPVDLAVLFHADPEGKMASRLKKFVPGAEVRVFPGFPPEHTQTHAAFHLAACLETSGCPIRAAQAFEHAFRVPLLGQDAGATSPKNDELPLRTKHGTLTGQELSKRLPRPLAPRNDGIGLLTKPSQQNILGKSARRVILHPGSGSAKKNHPPQFWLDFAGRLSRSHPFSLIVLLGPAEEGIFAFFQQNLHPDGEKILLCPDPPNLLSVLSQAPLYAGQDSGITHLAAMVGAPTLALFKNTAIAQWRPLGPRVRIMAQEEAGPDFLDEVTAQAEELLREGRVFP